MRFLVRYFLEGLAFVVPITLTLYILYFIITTIDGLFRIPVPGVGFVITLAGITLVGFLASNFLTGKLLSWIDGLFTRLPLVRLLYNSIKDLIEAFVGDKQSFNRPALVRLSSADEVYVLGFITCDNLNNLGIPGLVSVYLPQSYNFAGNLVLVPAENVKPLDINSAAFMTFVVSGGAAGQPNAAKV